MSARYLLALFSVLLLGCAKEQMDDCFTSAGAWTVEQRSIPDVRIIALNDRVDLEITQDSGAVVPHIAVEAGQNILPNVVTEVRDGVLHISNDMRCNWVRNMKVRPLVRITLRALDELVYRGIGDVSATTALRGATFRLDQRDGHGTIRLTLQVDTCWVGLHTGVGDAVLAGTAGAAYLYTAGFGPIDARQLEAGAVYVNNSGTGDIRCRPVHTLHAQLFSVGDVYYSGDPADLRSSIFASGRLIRVP